MDNKDKVYTLNDLIDKWDVSRRTLLKYIKEGKLKAFRIGNDWRVTQIYYDEFVEKNTKKVD